jgi:hypothetical protein
MALAPLSWGEPTPLVDELVDDFSGLTRLQTSMNCAGGFCSQLYTTGEYAVGYFGHESSKDRGLQLLKIKVDGEDGFFTISATLADSIAKNLGSPLELEPNEKARFVGDYKFLYEDGRFRNLIQLKLSDELLEKLRGTIGKQIKIRFVGENYQWVDAAQISNDGQWAQFLRALDKQ